MKLRHLPTLALVFASIALPLAAQVASPPADASKLDSKDLGRLWSAHKAGGDGSKAGGETPEASAPRSRGLRSRGAGGGGSAAPAAPATVFRGAGMSSRAAEANDPALGVLASRGVKTLKGAEAVAAQHAQDQSAAPAQPAPAADTPPRPSAAFVALPVDESRQIAFRLNFKKDSTEFADSDSIVLLAKAAEAMKTNPGRIFLLEGHTCDLGAPEHNQTLSESRALRVRHLLAQLGVPPEELLAIGRGQACPLVPNADEPSRAENRRVMIGPVETAAE